MKSLRKVAMILAVFVFSAKFAPLQAQSGRALPLDAAVNAQQMAEQRFKNIQTLKGIPADDIIPTMQFISNSLGVGCEFCHVRDAFDKDDKKPKQTARKMIQMQMAINKDNFNGHTAVTCNSCHHGAQEPAGIPIIAENAAPPAMGPAPRGPMSGGPNSASNLPAGPTPDQLLEKMVQAEGGADALAKITSRVEKGELSGFGPNPLPVEIYAKAPDMRLSVMHTPRGDSLTAYNGHEGWMGGAGPSREITGGELENARLDADFYFATDVKKLYRQFRPRPPEKVGDQMAYVLLAFRPGQPPLELFLDEQSGLLVREVQYVETPLGRNPTQITFGDYRDVDGVKVPYRMTLARPLGRFTITFDQVQQNVPIDDAKFAKPPAPPQPAPAP